MGIAMKWTIGTGIAASMIANATNEPLSTSDRVQLSSLIFTFSKYIAAEWYDFAEIR